MRRRAALPRTSMVMAIALSMLACEKDKSTTAPPAVPNPSLDNIWPNDDGRSWTFDLTMREWTGPGPPSTPCNSVPPAPTLLEVAALLESPQVGDSVVTSTGTERLHFDGMLTTGSGATGQNLIETLISSDSSAVVAASNRTLLAHLYIARPDLRGKIRARNPSITAGQVTQSGIHGPLLLHGGAWEKTGSYIGTYGVLDTLLAWKFLEANLAPGSEFSHQLVPDLADDIFLHGRVHRSVTWQTSAGTYSKALECIYLIDYGVSHATDSTGQSFGCVRSLTYGSVVYAPTVGPVYCYERTELAPAELLPDLGFGHLFDIELRLIETGLPVTGRNRDLTFDTSMAVSP